MGPKSPPSEPLPYGWEWFEALPELPGIWNWAARSSTHHEQECHLTQERSGVIRSDDSAVGLFAASIVWRAFLVNRAAPRAHKP